MAWIAALASVAGGLLANNASKNAARGMQYQPWNVDMDGVGSARFRGGALHMSDFNPQLTEALRTGQMGSLGQFFGGQQNRLGQDFLRGSTEMADNGQGGALNSLLGNPNNNFGGYQGQDMMQGLNAGMLGNFNPNQASSDYTNLLRQQAQPQEQQAASSALTNLFGSGRLGSTGGMNAYQGLMNSQNQADIGRQVAGQQFGLQQQLASQQGYDQARMNQQGMMLNNFGAGQQGLMNQFGINQGMFDRNMGLYTASNTATQDRFNRAMQLFGSENAMNQQDFSNFSGLLGAQQSQNQQLMDMARIGSSVGQAQTTANSNAAMVRNQGTQDMFAGFMNAANQYAQSRRNSSGSG